MKTLAMAVAVGLAATMMVPAAVNAQSPPAVVPYAVAVTPTAPAVVGYTAEPAGVLGWRTRYRPVVAPVQVAPVTYVKPVYTSSVDPYKMPEVRYQTPVVNSYYVPTVPAYLPRY